AAQGNIKFKNTTRTMSIPWAFSRSHKVWTDEEYDLNTGGGDFVQAKDFASVLDQQAKTDHVNGLDFELFKVPDYANMESTSPTGDRKAYSLPALISEDGTRKRPPSSVWNSNNVQNLDVTTNAAWDNKRRLYGPDLKDPDTGVLKRFDQIML